jgi:large subunit ribosomal protein L9
MEIILLKDVDNVGLRGDVVDVARGYARNFLLPRRLAEPATPAKVAELQKRDAQRALHEAKSFDEAQQLAERVGSIELRFDVKAGPTGSLFGSVTPTDIADELWEKHKIRVDRRKIATDSIKRVGYYDVPIELFADVTAEVKTVVAPEGGTLPPEEEFRARAAAEAAAAEEVARAEAEAAAAEEAVLEEAVLEEAVLEEAVLEEAVAVEAVPEEPAEPAPAEPEPTPAEEPELDPAAQGEPERTENAERD